MTLEQITDPKQIKSLDLPELRGLAIQTRKRIVDVVSKTGGHIAPSLGAVDFTIALLNVFDAATDKIVWDVGHQSYAWKILTGRNDRFDTLRTSGGISGFTNRDESPYDAFSTGHSSTSISAALGMACARDILGERSHAIAVIGDGALTGGMSFEALNHVGHLQPDKFIVILNDNAMSISKNVGGLQKYMARMLASKEYNSLKKQIWDLSHSLPSSIRRRFIYGAQKLEESMMNILVPNIIFEDLGLKYVGPIDGHNMEQLTGIFRRVKNYMVGPVLIHLVTKKGKGYYPAEKNASLFHGVGAFDPKSGKTRCSGSESWSEVMGTKVLDLARENKSIVAITAAMAAGTGLDKFEAALPDRFFDVGIAEQHAVTLAAGISTRGLKPFVAIYSTFFQRALDQIIHDVCLPHLPVVFCIDRAGLVGEDGATHHGAFDISFLSYIPNLQYFAPSTAQQLRQILAWAASYLEGPVAIRYPRGAADCTEMDGYSFSPGKAVLMAEGEGLALVSTGDTLPMVKEIHKSLSEKGYQASLVDLLSIKPLDEALIRQLASTHRYIFSFESNVCRGGIGAYIAQILADTPCRTACFGYPDSFVPHGATDLLNQQIGFTAPQLSEQILSIIASDA